MSKKRKQQDRPPVEQDNRRLSDYEHGYVIGKGEVMYHRYESRRSPEWIKGYVDGAKGAASDK